MNIIILSGPSGVGKTTVLDKLLAQYPDKLERIITTTTRERRSSEINGKDYYFLSREEFEGAISSEEMIEYAIVHGNYYGSTIAELERIIRHWKNPVYNIDPQGMVHLKPLLQKKGYTVKTIFLLPPSIAELRARLDNRGTENKAHLELRLANAMVEMEEEGFYDHRIINENLDDTIEMVAEVMFSS